MEDNLLQIKWLIAAVAPWTISPHPNFSEKSLDAPAYLALVTERRFSRETQRYKLEALPTAEPWAQFLIDQAEKSLNADTQAGAVQQLSILAETVDLPHGARAAAALYASVGLTELEQATKAADLINAVILNIRRDSFLKASASLRLAIAILTSQRIARLFDSQQFRLAEAAVHDLLEIVPAAGDSGFDEFTVSKGISWRSSSVQRDIATSLRKNALRTKTSLETPFSSSWAKSIRSKAGWIEMRTAFHSAERDRLVVRDNFERRFESTSGTQHFMRESSIEAGYGALLIAELSGFVWRIRWEREELGKILLLESKGSQHHAREAIRLFRQSGASKSLSTALDWLVNQGPTDPLRGESKAILMRAEAEGWATETDLQVLGASAPVLSNKDRRRAINVALAATSTERLGYHAGWASHDKIWRAVAQLKGDHEKDALVLEAAAHLIDDPDLLSAPLAGRITRVFRSLDWDRTRSSDRERWINWAATADSNYEIAELRRVVLSLAADNEESPPPELSLDLAVFYAEKGAKQGSHAPSVAAVRQYLIDSLRDEAWHAKAGRISFGGYSTANVAVAFALRFSEPELWESITEHLLDEKLDVVLKEDALERIANFADDVPDFVRRDFAQARDKLLSSPRSDGMLMGPAKADFPEAILAMAALGTLDAERAISTVMQLAAAGDTERISAARIIPFILDYERVDATWALSILLMLSRDQNPLVRAEAGTALVHGLSAKSPLNHMVRQRIIDLLATEGLRGPASIIHAVRRVGETRLDDVAFLRDHLKKKSQSTSVPRVLRDLSRRLVTDLWGDIFE